MGKITVVGAGKVGSTVAQVIAYKQLGDVVLINRTAGKAKGIALDLMESSPVMGFDVTVSGGGDFKESKGSEVAIITAGLPRKEGMSRDELLSANATIVGGIAKKIARYSPRAIIITVTNPLDVMTYVSWKASKFPSKRIVGMAGMLDTSRFRSFVSRGLRVPGRLVKGIVLGGHGDFMLPLPRLTTIKGKPLNKLLPRAEVKRIIKRTVNAGAEIISLEGDSAYYAPASSVAHMVESIVNNKKLIIPCSTWLNGEYGIRGVFLGVPVKLGKQGVEKVVEIPLKKEEQKHLKNSAEKIRMMLEKTGF